MPGELQCTVMLVCFRLFASSDTLLTMWISVRAASKEGVEGKGTDEY